MTEGSDASDDSNKAAHGRLRILDGWRAVSILFVLAGHWLPIGPAALKMNAAVAASGMAIFFSLSGFLITSIALQDARALPFLLKRATRIVPLAWLAIGLLAALTQPEWHVVLANVLFVANIPPISLLHGGGHLWSLCVEVQFYVFVALLMTALGRRGLYLLPPLCLLVTGYRIWDGKIITIVTWYRVDEILAGAVVALLWHHYASAGWRCKAWFSPACLVLLLLAANPHSGAFGYARPYLAAGAVGASLYAFPALLKMTFESNVASYIAKISYALYVAHGALGATWLGGEQSDKVTKYLLRIPLAAATFVVAHLSTFYFESSFTRATRGYLSKNALSRKR